MKAGRSSKIERKIAAQAKLGKNGEFRAALMRGGGKVENAGGVAFEVANGWIELGERYLHARISAYGRGGAKANGDGSEVAANCLPRNRELTIRFRARDRRCRSANRN